MKWKQSLALLWTLGFFFGELLAQPCESQSNNLLIFNPRIQNYPNIQNPPSFFAPFPYEFDSIPPVEPGFFTMTNDMGPWQGAAMDWVDVGDNTPSPYGYMMVVNAHADPGPFWTEWTSLCGDADYIFTFDAINLYDPTLPQPTTPNLELYFNGVSVMNFGDLPQDGQWHTYTASFYVDPGGGDFPLDINNNIPGGIGNILAIDNISLIRCGPEIFLTEVNPQQHCPGDSIIMNVSLGANNYVDPWFQWQISTDGGQSWGTIGSATNATTFTVYDLPISAQIRAEVVPMQVDLGNPACTTHGDGFPVSYFSPVDCSDVITEIGGFCSGQRGSNVFPNGDFGSGLDNILSFDPGYAPGYVYEFDPPPNDGTYTITNYTGDWGSFAAFSWINIYDNSPDTNGYMMVVNASPTPGTFYEETVSVCENTNYEFSCDVISVNWPIFSGSLTEPNISFVIDGVEVFSTGNVPIDSTWHTYGFTVTTAPGVTSLDLSLRNNTPGGLSFIGNDLAIDNISFRACGSNISLSEISTAPFCEGEEVEWEASIGPGFDSPVIQWQISFDGGLMWQDHGVSTTQVTSLMSNIQQNFHVRALVGETVPNLTEPTCRLTSDTLFFEVLPSFETQLVESICQGQTYTVGNETFTDPGSYQLDFTAETGCDSIVFLDLTVDVLSGTVETEICAGETITFGTQTISFPGVYNELFTTMYGCDSIVTLTLTALDTFFFLQNTIVCSGEEVNGISLFSDTTFVFEEQSLNGCDSTVVLQVAVLDSFLVQQSTAVCQGEMVFGIPVFSDTTILESNLTVFGCDSTIIWSVEVLATPFVSLNTDLCEGELFNGVPIFSDTLWVENLQSSLGCDSTVHHHITVNPVYDEMMEVTLCLGDVFNGIPVSMDTVFVFSNTSVFGCDSISTVNIIVEDLSAFAVTGDTAICEGEITTLSAGDFNTYQWSTGEMSPSIEVNAPGNYAVTVTSENDCDAVDFVEVILQEISASFLESDPMCFDVANGSIEVFDLTGAPPFNFILNGVSTQSDSIFENLPSGDYALNVMDANGCTLNQMIVLQNPPEIDLNLEPELTIGLGGSVQLAATSNVSINSWLWLPEAGLSCTDCEQPFATPSETTTYTLLVTDANGCTATAQVTIFVKAEQRVYVPNAFSPNSDGLNDFFTIYTGPGVTNIIRFEIFDRWGEHLFSVPANSAPNDPFLRWDGKFRGKKMQPAVYVWFAEIEFVDGNIQLQKGEVILMK